MTAPWGPPIDVLPLLAREEQALIDVLSGLRAAEWAKPAAGEWTVHDLTAHVLGLKLRRLSRERDGHAGDGPVEAWVPAFRLMSPEVLFAMFVDSTAQLTELWKHRDLDGPAPLWLTVARDYAEQWVHHQQIREAVGVPLLDEPEFRTPVVDTFLRSLPQALRDIAARTGRQVACTIDGAGRWTVRAASDGWAIDRGAATSRSPLATLTVDADAFWRSCSGLPAAKAQVSGDPAVCEILLSLRAPEWCRL
ncbi:maleylpyruvate isomerase family mycothiol-dependent enzyme [Amycolatopsis benzoatilytica]|uniref:maleylpyruvate isomerase family mycothiol-dependent enzyme n=1 Tax=Amycolatopsis benzoatilytica TaxID=346045 RepID=UPI0003A8B5C2|nr:maleylpyruvate isomerase family mycothiol-dependent enzyme [Amycolatopsis benzoatilytica]